MKTKLDIFSSTKLKDFFQNLEGLFDISLKNFDDLDECYNASNISIVFFNDQGFIEDTILNNVLQKENFIFIFRELSMFDKSSIDLKKNIVAPISIGKFLDKINEIIIKKNYTYRNIDLNNNIITNTITNEKAHITEAENLIMLKLFNDKTVNKKILERDVLHIKQDLNTSSIESHLNRIRKKLKKIDSEFSVYSKDNNVFLDMVNGDK